MVELDSRRQQITDLQAVVNTEVVEAGVTRADGGDATVLMVIIQSAQANTARPQAQISRYRIQVDPVGEGLTPGADPAPAGTVRQRLPAAVLVLALPCVRAAAGVLLWQRLDPAHVDPVIFAAARRGIEAVCAYDYEDSGAASRASSTPSPATCATSTSGTSTRAGHRHL